MNQRELASVLFAVVGLFVAISHVPAIVFHVSRLIDGSFESALNGISGRAMATIGLAASFVAILLAGSLVLFRDRLAHRLFAASGQAQGTRDLQAVALSVLGCYFAVRAISQFAWAPRFDWSIVIQVGLGIALFFGASGLSGLWMLARAAGQPRGSPGSAV
jgi:hypothetical protein